MPSLRSLLDKIPHWAIVVLFAGVGAAVSYLQAEPDETLVTALSSWATLKPLLIGAATAGVGTMVALLRKAPWAIPSATSNGDVEIKVTRVPTPPPLPVLFGVFLVVAVLPTLLLGAALSACAHAGPGEVTAADVAIYEAEQDVCVAQATDGDAGRACIDEVRRMRCGPGGLWVDAGVCPAPDPSPAPSAAAGDASPDAGAEGGAR